MPLADELASPSLEQAYKNHVKVARAAIRLRHSIAADNELSVMLPKIKVRLQAQMQDGRIDGMTVAEMLVLVEGVDAVR